MTRTLTRQHHAHPPRDPPPATSNRTTAAASSSSSISSSIRSILPRSVAQRWLLLSATESDTGSDTDTDTLAHDQEQHPLVHNPPFVSGTADDSSSGADSDSDSSQLESRLSKQQGSSTLNTIRPLADPADDPSVQAIKSLVRRLVYLHLFFPLFLSYRILFIPYTFIVLVICIQILLAVDIPLPNSSSTRANINDMNYLDMERLLTRCSICFDASHDFCLKSCKDQFCRNCFQRYVAQLVRNSWGLSVLPVTCPVCQDPLDQCEWQNYVEAETVKLYNKYNRPYRPMTRACGVCCSDIVCAPAPIFEHHIRERRFEEIHSILEDLLTVDGHINFFSFNTLAKYQADVSSHMKGGKTGVAEIYTYIMRDVRDSLEHRPQSMTRNIDEMMASLSHISQLFLSLEHRPGKWKELQFQHVNMFPQAVCLTCHSSVCFSCGATPYHTGQSCTESIQQTISLGGSSDAIASLRWKLMNGKRCPNCSILINREEGCNKVDCLFCGHKFCWQCLGKFDNGGCGFYRCQLGGVTDDTATGHSKGSDDSPELGVPNMMDIQAKWQKG